MTYKSKPENIQNGTPILLINKGWRINKSLWRKMIDHPNRGTLRLQSALKDLKLDKEVKYINEVFDPEWHGRFDTCVDGSFIMFLAQIPMPDGSNGYIDIPATTKTRVGANGKLLKAKIAYCERNNIPLLILWGTYRSDEMKYLIQEWRNKRKPPS